MSIGTSIATFLYYYSDCVCALYPFRSTQHKGRQTCTHSKVVKFDHFEIRIMNHLPSTKKFNSVAVSQPVLDYIGRTVVALFGSCHICEGDIILFL